MNHPTFFRLLLLVVAGLVCTVQSSYIDPPEPSRPPIPPAEPAQYGNHIEQVCGIKIGGGWTYDGTCQFPVSVDQCENGMSVRTKSWSKRPCPVDESSVSEEDEDEPRRYLCCIRQVCGPGLVGRCQNSYKNCPGEWLIGELNSTPIENNCPIKDETFIACCDPRNPSSKAEDRRTKSSSLMLGLCSATSEKACGLEDESQIPTDPKSKKSLGASLGGAELQNGYGMYGNQANGEPQIKDQSYLDSDKDSIQTFPDDFPLETVASQMTKDPIQHDGWEWDSLPPLLVNSAPSFGPGSYLQNSPSAKALAPADAASDSNTETSNDFY